MSDMEKPFNGEAPDRPGVLARTKIEPVELDAPQVMATESVPVISLRAEVIDIFKNHPERLKQQEAAADDEELSRCREPAPVRPVTPPRRLRLVRLPHDKEESPRFIT